jgi:predicted GIY-YIG superfamily endonuclease
MDGVVDSILDASFFLKYSGPHVYLWRRGFEYLYIGSSLNVLSRLASHDKVGKIEPLQQNDQIQLIRCQDKRSMLSFEKLLIQRYRPRHNQEWLHPVSARRRKRQGGETPPFDL